MSTHKALGNDDYKVETYVTYASQSFTVVFGSNTNPPGLTLSVATEPSSSWLIKNDNGIYNTDSGIYSNILFKSVKHLFYTQGVQVFYTSSVSQSTNFYPTGSFYTISAARNEIGDRIKERSVVIKLKNLPTYIYDEPSSVSQMGYLRVSGSNSVVGNIFYYHGLMTLKMNPNFNVVDQNGIRLNVEDSISVDFQSTATIYNHRITCQIEPNEFNLAWFNPTISGSYASSGSVSNSGSKIYDLMASGSLTPYVTTIGLYNDEYQLLAVAKLSSPIKRSFLTKQTFVVHFDTN